MTLLEALEYYFNQDNNSQKSVKVIAKWMADTQANNEQLNQEERDYLESNYNEQVTLMKDKARSFNRLIKEKE